MELLEFTQYITGHTPGQVELHFPNGFGASVIRNQMSYGHEYGQFEVAVLRAPDWRITTDTAITDDVLGYLTAEEVRNVLARIMAL